MHALSLEMHSLKTASLAGVADDVARHLLGQLVYGRAAVVSDRPDEFMAELRRVWNRMERELRFMLGSETDNIRRSEIITQSHYMRQCTFATTPPIQESSAWVVIATAKQFLAWPPVCQAMYITCPISSRDRHLITSWMPRYGTVIMYKREYA